MDSDHKCAVWITALVVAGILGLVLLCWVLSNAQESKYIEAGYTRQSLVGMERAQWVKIDPNK